MIGKRYKLRLAGWVAIAVSIAFAAWWVYTAGYDAGRAAANENLMTARLIAEQERNEALSRLADAQVEITRVQADAAKRIAAAQRKAVTHTKTVERVVREEPEFAAIVRPADLDRVRDEQLAELEQAADRGSDLSARGFRGLRSPDPNKRQNPWGN
jgi:hypothetical protein